MKQVNYASEATFKSELVEFPDEQYELAESLHKIYENELWSKCTPIMVRDDKKSLVFCVNLGDKEKDRVDYECGKNAYKVIIEPINKRI